MKDFKSTIDYNGQKMDLVFDLNVMEQIQDEYGSLEHWGELTSPDPEPVLDEKGKVIGETQKEPDIKAFLFGFTAMLNEGIDMANEADNGNRPFLSKKQVGRIISTVGMTMASEKLKDLVVGSTDTGADGKKE